MDELSFSSDSSYKSINELRISVVSEKKASNTAISKIGSLAKQWQCSEDARVQGGFIPEEEYVLTIKEEDEGTESVPVENSLEN